MGLEIERKFLVTDMPLNADGSWRRGKASRIAQGYLCRCDRSVTRIRVAQTDGASRAWLTIKGPNTGATRVEFEYEIPVSEAQEMLDTMCDAVIDKTRFVLMVDAERWEVDEFYGENEGLIVAEIELKTEDQDVVLPAWVDREVTGDPRYYNSNLSERPFSTW